MHSTTDEVGDALRLALVRHMYHLDASERVHLRERHDTGCVAGGVVKLAGIRLRVGNQLLEALRGHLGVDVEEEGVSTDVGDGGEAGDRIVGTLFHRRHHGHRTVGPDQQRVAIGCRVRYSGGTDSAVGPRLVLYHDGLAECGGHRLTEDTRKAVSRRAAGERHNDPNRFGWICVSDGTKSRKRENNCEKTDELTHGALPCTAASAGSRSPTLHQFPR